MEDTPLGRIVAIRSEKDAKTIRKFSPEQRRILREWQKKKAKEMRKDKKAYAEYWTAMQRELKNAYCRNPQKTNRKEA